MITTQERARIERRWSNVGGRGRRDRAASDHERKWLFGGDRPCGVGTYIRRLNPAVTKNYIIPVLHVYSHKASQGTPRISPKVRAFYTTGRVGVFRQVGGLD